MSLRGAKQRSNPDKAATVLDCFTLQFAARSQ
jgi:hypothetical protein